jgi:hypothetical protein
MFAFPVLAMYNLADSYYSLQRHNEAMLLWRKVLDIRQRVLPEGHPDIGKLHFILKHYFPSY